MGNTLSSVNTNNTEKFNGLDATENYWKDQFTKNGANSREALIKQWGENRVRDIIDPEEQRSFQNRASRSSESVSSDLSR